MLTSGREQGPVSRSRLPATVRVKGLRASALALSCASVLCGAASLHAAQLMAVAHNGSEVLGPGTSLRKFRNPFASDAPGGRIVFRSTVFDPDNPQNLRSILRLAADGSGQVVAARGEDAGLGTTFRNFLQPSINDSGDVAWYAFLSDGGRGIFRTIGADPGNRRTVVRRDGPSPVVGYTFSEFDAPEIANDGRVVFWGRAESGTDAVEGLFSCNGGDGDCTGSGSGTLTTLIKSGDLLPGAGSVHVCGFAPSLSVNTYGIAFRAELKADCAAPGATSEGVLRLDFANTVGPEVIATVGGATGDTGVFSRFRDGPDIASDGTLVFRADTTDVDINEAIFVCNPAPACPGTNRPDRIVTKGDDGSGTLLRSFGSPQITNQGDVFFMARPRGPSISGPTIYLWRNLPDTLEVVATRGQLVNDPNLPAETRFRRVGSIHVSRAGNVVFRSSVTGTSLDWRTGIFLWQE